MSARLKRIKRNLNRRQDNQDALDHGFYSSSLNPDEKRLFLNLVSEEPIAPEILAVKIKLQSLLWQIPSNPYALGEISRLTAKWSADRYRMDKAARANLKAVAAGVLEYYSEMLHLNLNRFRKPPNIKKTNQFHSRVMQKHQNESNRKTN